MEKYGFWEFTKDLNYGKKVYFSGVNIVKILPIGSYLQTRIIISLSKNSACLIANSVLSNKLWLIFNSGFLSFSFFFLRDFCLHKILFRCQKSLYETAESLPQVLFHIPLPSHCRSQRGFFEHRLKMLIQIKTYCTARYSDTNTNIVLDFDRNILQSTYPNAFLKTACVTEGGTRVVAVT